MPVYLCQPGYDTEEPWKHVLQVYSRPFRLSVDTVTNDHPFDKNDVNPQSSSIVGSTARPAAVIQQQQRGMKMEGTMAQGTSSSTAAAEAYLDSTTRSIIRNDENNNNDKIDMDTNNDKNDTGGVDNTTTTYNDAIPLRRIRHSEVLLADQISIHYNRYWLRLRFPGPHGGFAGYVALGPCSVEPASLPLGFVDSSSSSGGGDVKPTLGRVERQNDLSIVERNAAVQAAAVVAATTTSPVDVDNSNSHSSLAVCWTKIDSAIVHLIDTSSPSMIRQCDNDGSGISDKSSLYHVWIQPVLTDVLLAIKLAQAKGSTNVRIATTACRERWAKKFLVVDNHNDDDEAADADACKKGMRLNEFNLLWSKVKELALAKLGNANFVPICLNNDSLEKGGSAMTIMEHVASNPAIICFDTNLFYPTSREFTILPHYEDGLKSDDDDDTAAAADMRRLIVDKTNKSKNESGSLESFDNINLLFDDDDDMSATQSQDNVDAHHRTGDSEDNVGACDVNDDEVDEKLTRGEEENSPVVFEGSDVEDEEDVEDGRASSLLLMEDEGKEPVFCRICRDGLHDVEYNPPTSARETAVAGGVPSVAARSMVRRESSFAPWGESNIEEPQKIEDNVIGEDANDDDLENDVLMWEEDIVDPRSGHIPNLSEAELSHLKALCSSHPSVENPLLSPCECSGSMAFVHYLCVEQWRCRSRHPAAKSGTHCETCGVRYTLPPPLPRSGGLDGNRQNAPLFDRGGEANEDWLEAMPPHVLAALRRPHFWWQVGVAIVRRRYLRPVAPIIVSPLVALYCRARRILKKRGVSRRRWSCSLCRRRARWKCVRCLRSYYCSRQCQNVSWHILHKHVCYKPARFWWSAVVYTAAWVAACPGILSDPLVYAVGLAGVIPTCFVIVGVLGGGIATMVKHTTRSDIRGRYLELLVVVGTIGMALLSWGPVWGYFGYPAKCSGITTLPMFNAERFLVMWGPISLLIEKMKVSPFVVSLRKASTVSQSITITLLRQFVLLPGSVSLNWIDRVVLHSGYPAKYLCSPSSNHPRHEQTPNALNISWLTSYFSAWEDLARIPEMPPASSISPPGMTPETVGESVEGASCFPKLAMVDPDFLTVSGGQKCAADVGLVTLVWFAAIGVVLINKLFKRRERRLRFAFRGAVHRLPPAGRPQLHEHQD